MKRVLFVCTGNTCRSPMAEAILKSKNLPGVEVRSAGVYAVNGSDASLNAKKVLEENNIAMNHKSTLLSGQEVDWADLVLTMTAGHKGAVISHFPQAESKTFTLKEFAGEDGFADIGDPFGGSLEMYRAAYGEIKDAIEGILYKIDS
ncbi:low molecular weight protein arginine phosphatase [Mesobacillus foraminis]|uniref:low molecular weight protein arginine phosphatase n=1 Tax=Mesobacillus foraminis TaxID=279826 RepID=UPI000EF4500F|nr:low molecular weight protein arginine phosphatase [Mesobacillus foraminis]